MHYSVREASQDDHQSLNDLFAELDRFHRQALAHLFQEPEGPARSEGFLAGITSGEDSLVLIAEHEGQAVGFIHVLVRETPAIPILKPRHFAVIESLFVRETARRSGIGGALVEPGHRWASIKGAADMELNVWEFNQAAVAFY